MFATIKREDGADVLLNLDEVNEVYLDHEDRHIYITWKGGTESTELTYDSEDAYTQQRDHLIVTMKLLSYLTDNIPAPPVIPS